MWRSLLREKRFPYTFVTWKYIHAFHLTNILWYAVYFTYNDPFIIVSWPCGLYIQIPVQHPAELSVTDFLNHTLTIYSLLPSLLSRTIGFHWLPRYSSSETCSPWVICIFLDFLLSLTVYFGKSFVLSFLKSFLHITYCCLSSLLLQE